MGVEYVLNAEARSDMGKGASRRLRREGKVPGIIYGSDKEPQAISLTHHELANQAKNETFYSHILTIKLNGKDESAIIKDMQRHPAKPMITHVDFQRVNANEKIRVHVPLHFINEAKAPGVKAGGLATHSLIEVEVSCLPKHLPEFIEVDLGDLELNGIIHLSNLKLAEGVELVELLHGAAHDQAVVSIHLPRAAKEAEETAEEAAPAAPAAGEAPKA